MNQLISFYEDEPVDLKGKVEVAQRPMSHSSGYWATSGPIQPRSVYVVASSSPDTATVIVPFGAFDDWFLRERYNEALRIMTDLGASEIKCEAFRRVRRRSKIRVGHPKAAIEGSVKRVENSGFDFSHVGTGAPPQDPAPLRWPNEPGFESARANVLRNGSSEVSITINSSNTFSIGSDLGKLLKDFGFELGLSHEKSVAHTLNITAKFPPSKRGIF